MNIVKTVQTITHEIRKPTTDGKTLPFVVVYKRIMQIVDNDDVPLITWQEARDGKRRYIPFKIQQQLEAEYQKYIKTNFWE